MTLSIQNLIATRVRDSTYCYAKSLYAECRQDKCHYGQCLYCYAECLYAECFYAECRGATYQTLKNVTDFVVKNTKT